MSADTDHITTTPFDFESFVKGKLDDLKSNGSYRQFITIDKQIHHFPKFIYKDTNGDIKEATNWCTNDYLALSTWSGNKEQAIEITAQSGTGSGGTRNISGSTTHHRLLESTLARWHGKESALLFNSAYQANLTTLSTLGRHVPELIFLSDEENHASMIEGMRSTDNRKVIFRHNDLQHLESLLKTLEQGAPKIIVFESVYSISGTIAPIAAIIKLAKSYNCLTYIDEVHAVGLYGSNGSGVCNQLGLSHEVDFINGTLSKAIGVFGGYITASGASIDFIRSFGSGFIFTTSLPPAVCAAAHHSILEIESNHTLRKDFFSNVQRLRNVLDEHLISYTGDETHITSIHIGNATRCKDISDRLLTDYGVYLQPINHPTVPKGKECLRITITPRHNTDDILYLAQKLTTVLQPKVVLTGRSSRLSKVQIQIVQQKIQSYYPGLSIEIRYKESKGDRLAQIPLHTQDGIDFFTEDIYTELLEGHADIAVHSLKDMSSSHFFGNHHFAVIDRDEVRDVAIFNSDILTKIKSGQTIRIGTCSFRREYMALAFLKNVLPHEGSDIDIQALPIRGNIDTRLKKLTQKEYDGIIIAAAGINRMLQSDSDAGYFRELLMDKKWMILPLVDCVPAPCQGAIVVETIPRNKIARMILQKINDQKLHDDAILEKKVAMNYGTGCIQKFGVTTVHLPGHSMVLAKGIDEAGQNFEFWHGLDVSHIDFHPEYIISSDELGFAPIKVPSKRRLSINQEGYFVAHISAVDSFDSHEFENNRIWAAGVSTWMKLAKKGIWVEGCADSLGFEHIHSLLKTALVDLDPYKIMILTNQTSAENWENSGYKSLASYSLKYQSSLIDKYKLTASKLIFWKCFAHFEAIKSILPEGIVHACLPGKSADCFKKAGINPIVFPTINAFNQWKKSYSQAFIAA